MNNKEWISSAAPSISPQDVAFVSRAVEDGWGGKMNFYLEAFQEEFSAYIGVKYCLPVAHCTDALHLAFMALGIGEGDEVIVPDITWVASISPLLHLGAIPVFCDVDADTWCISIVDLKSKISSSTKAVVAVDLLGNVAQFDEIRKICEANNLHLVEDSAEALGSTYLGKSAGTFGDVSVFSFNATKLIMAGQGGCLCTDNEEIYAKAKLLSHHGIDKTLTGYYYWSHECGFNFNWTNMQAALCLSQLRRIDELIAYKQHIFQLYRTLLTHENFGFQLETQGVSHVRWINGLLLSCGSGCLVGKESVVDQMALRKIDIRPFFYQVSSMPPYLDYTTSEDADSLTAAAALSYAGIMLPNGYNLNEKKVSIVCENLIEVVDQMERACQ